LIPAPLLFMNTPARRPATKPTKMSQSNPTAASCSWEWRSSDPTRQHVAFRLNRQQILDLGNTWNGPCGLLCLHAFRPRLHVASETDARQDAAQKKAALAMEAR
jgi:hypothetical protein